MQALHRLPQPQLGPACTSYFPFSDVFYFLFFCLSGGSLLLVLRHSPVMDSKTESEKKTLTERDCHCFGQFLYDTKFWTSAAVKSLWTRDSCLWLELGHGGLYGGKESFPGQVKPTRAFSPTFPSFPPPHTIISRRRNKSRGIPESRIATKHKQIQTPRKQ